VDLGLPVPEYWILLEPKMMEVVVTAGAIRCAKPHSSPQTNQHPVFYKPDAIPVIMVSKH